VNPKQFFQQYVTTEDNQKELEKCTIVCGVCGKDITEEEDGVRITALLNNKFNNLDLLYGITLLFCCKEHDYLEVEKAHIDDTMLILMSHLVVPTEEDHKQVLLNSINRFNN
jgi:hypothetical protein